MTAPVNKRNPAMDAIIKHIHGNPAYSVENVAKAVSEARAKYKKEGEMTAPTLPELPEPTRLWSEADDTCIDHFTAAQMLAIRDAAIQYGMEVAAQLCDVPYTRDTGEAFAAAIRARAKGKE